MFDFHLHLARFESPTTVAKGLFDVGTGFNTIACEPWEWEKSLDLESRGLEAHQAFGIHPMVATQMTDEDFEHLKTILRTHPEADVGECGLDKRFEGYGPAGIQEQVFKKQIGLAQDLNRPLHIHCVGDYSRILQAVADDARQIPQVVFHRFGGDISVVRSAQKLLGPRAVFSLHADSFRKKSTVAAIREIPPEQVRFETDADDESWTAERIIHQLKAVEELFLNLTHAC